MQFGQKQKGSLLDKFAPNSEYYVLCDTNKLYIKEASFEGKNLSQIKLSANVQDCQFSPNSEAIAVLLKKSNMIMVYSVRDGNPVAKIQDGLAGIGGFLWCKDSSQIIAFSDNNYKCSIYNLSNQTISYLKNPKLPNKKGCCFTKDGKFMALLERHDCKDYIGIYYTVDWKLINSFQIQLADAVEILWAPNDSYLLAWDTCINYRLLTYCPMRGLINKFQPYNYALGIKTLRYATNCTFVAIGSFDEKIRLLNSLTWKFIGQLDCSNPTLNPNNVRIFKEEDLTKNPERMKIVEGNGYKVPTVKVIMNDKGPPNQGVSVIQMSPDDSLMACKNDNMPFTVFIWNTSSLTLHSVVSLNTYVKMFKWEKNEKNRLCIVTGTDRLLFWQNQQIEESEFRFEQDVMNIQKIRWSQDGKKMLLMDKNGVAVFAQKVEDYDQNEE